MELDIILTQQKNIQVEALVKLPKTRKDLRIKHFEALSDPLIELENPTLSDMCYFLAKFSNVDIETIKAFTVTDVQKMYEHVLKIFEGFKPKAMPPKEINLEVQAWIETKMQQISRGYPNTR